MCYIVITSHQYPSYSPFIFHSYPILYHMFQHFPIFSYPYLSIVSNIFPYVSHSFPSFPLVFPTCFPHVSMFSHIFPIAMLFFLAFPEENLLSISGSSHDAGRCHSVGGSSGDHRWQHRRRASTDDGGNLMGQYMGIFMGI